MSRYTVKPPANRKYVREILAQLPKGYQIGFVEEGGDPTTQARAISGSHPNVVTPDGELLRSSDGRLVAVAGTPGSPHSRTADLRLIKRAIEARQEAA